MTGLDENTVKAIDKKRLESLYVRDGKLIKPKITCTFMGIDEFKLHNDYRYVTHIIEMETVHILWIAESKKKQVVYDFIEHVGLEWMSNVEAVACDTNSDFEEIFVEKCPHIEQALYWFAKLLNNHFDGFVACAKYSIYAGKIEGINNRINTIRSMGYGYPDDEYSS